MNISISLNGFLIKNTEDPVQIVSTIFSSIEDLNYWSYEALEELYIGVFDIISKYCKEKQQILFGSKKTKYTRFISKNKYRFMPKSRDKMLAVIYDYILSSESLSRCAGFGFSNKFGDELDGNAEVLRLSKIK